MKKFNLAKGLLVGLLTLALCFAFYGAVNASAGSAAKEKITFKGTGSASGETYTVDNNFIDGEGWYKSNGTRIANFAVSGDYTDGDYTVSVVSGEATVKKGSENALEVTEGASSVSDGDTITYKSGVAYAIPAADVLNGFNNKKNYAISGSPTGATNVVYNSDSGEFTVSSAASGEVTVPVVERGVTFTLQPVTYGSVSGEYTFFSTEYAKDKEIKLADIIAGAKKTSGSGEKLEGGWILGETSASGGVTAGNEYLEFADGVYKIKKDIPVQESVTLDLIPAQVKAKFTAEVEEDTYVGEISVENHATEKTKIYYSDIVACLSKSGESTKKLTGKVITELEGGNTSATDYSGYYFEVENKDYLEDDFSVVPVTVNDMFMDGTGYVPEIDSLVFKSPVPLVLYWIDCKKQAGVSVKGEKLNSLSTSAVSGEGTDPAYNKAVLPLYDKEAGVKIAENKDAYIYVSTNSPAEAKTKYNGNYVIKGTTIKKLAVTLNYAGSSASGENCGVASVASTVGKSTTTYMGATGDKALSKVIDKLQWSTDGKEWKAVTAASGDTTGAENNFDTGALYEYVNGSSKTTVYFRLMGDEEDTETKTKATRGTKMIKVGIATAAAGKAVKVDALKGTIALKNGYDYCLGNDDTTEPKVEGSLNVWTILPFNKTGGATSEIINTIAFIPVKKVDENKAMFTKTKVKSIAIADLKTTGDAKVDTSADMYIWIRKSATSTKPAQKWECIKVSKVTKAPAVSKNDTVTDTSAAYYSVGDAKNVIADPTITKDSGDENGDTFEYLIVNASDDGKVDFTTAKWTTFNGKGITVGKSKSKYAVTGAAKAGTAVAKEGSIIYIRRAGDKSSSILPSNYASCKIGKTKVSVEVEKDGETKTEQQDRYILQAK